jgi:hypothetical protein
VFITGLPEGSRLLELMDDRAWFTPEVKARAERAIRLLRSFGFPNTIPDPNAALTSLAWTRQVPAASWC